MELSVTFNQYSMRSFQRALVGFNNLWNHLIFKECNWVCTSKIPSPPFQMGNWAKCLTCRIYSLLQRKFNSLFSIFIQIYFAIAYIWPTYHSFDLRISFTVAIFSLSKRAKFCRKYEFSLLNCHLFCLSSCYHGQNY